MNAIIYRFIKFRLGNKTYIPFNKKKKIKAFKTEISGTMKATAFLKLGKLKIKHFIPLDQF